MAQLQQLQQLRDRDLARLVDEPSHHLVLSIALHNALDNMLPSAYLIGHGYFEPAATAKQRQP